MSKDMIDLIIVLIGLIITVFIGWKQYYLAKKMNDFIQKQDVRDEKFRCDSVKAEAISFIQKYNRTNYKSDIYLLLLCIIAYEYNPIFPYRRKIYRDFCMLDESVRKQILSYYDINYNFDDDLFFDKNICDLIQDNRRLIWGESKHFDYFYNINYFTNALYKFGRELEPVDNNEFVTKVEDLLLKSNYDDNIEFRRTNLDNNFRYKFTTFDVAYLSLLVAKYIAIYYGEYVDNDIIDLFNSKVPHYDDYKGVRYMEDLFLETLFYVHFYKIDVENKV